MTPIKLALIFGSLAILAYSRLAYVRHYYVHSPEQALGAAMEPVNFISLLVLILSTVAFAIFAIGSIISHLSKQKAEPCVPANPL